MVDTLFPWFLLLIVAAALLALLNRWLMRHLQISGLLLLRDRQAASLFFFLFLLPGILLHELSHWLTARLLGVKTLSFSLWPRQQRNGRLELGAVEVEHGSILEMALIGLAPFLFGSAVLLLLVHSLSHGVDLAQLLVEPARLWSTLRAAPDIWLQLYLLFAVVNGMIPSEADRKPAIPVLLFAILLLGLSFLLGLWSQLSSFWLHQFFIAVRFLALSFAFALFVNIVVAIILLGFEWFMENVFGLSAQHR